MVSFSEVFTQAARKYKIRCIVLMPTTNNQVIKRGSDRFHCLFFLHFVNIALIWHFSGVCLSLPAE